MRRAWRSRRCFADDETGTFWFNREPVPVSFLLAAAGGSTLRSGIFTVFDSMLSLVGLPGSGKSSVGKAVARRLGRTWHDSDHEIEAQLGCTIREYFALEGEDAFRDREEEALDSLSLTPSIVLSTGGGAVLREINRQRLKERGTVIYLRSSPEALYRRLKNDTKRPLLQVADPLKRLRALYAERDPLYRECAHFVIDTHGSSLSMLVNRIMMQLELSQDGAAGGQSGAPSVDDVGT